MKVHRISTCERFFDKRAFYTNISEFMFVPEHAIQSCDLQIVEINVKYEEL